MKTAGWAGLFITSFLVGHFVANPWLYPVGKILLFIEIYILALVAFIILDQIIPYIWRTLSKWQVDFQQSTGMKEQNLSGGMRLSFAAAGLSSAMERGKEETNPQPEPMPRNLVASGDGAALTAATLLNATVTATGKKEEYWKEPDPPRKLVLLPPIKTDLENNPDQIISGDNVECSGEPNATCEAAIEDKANKEAAIVVEEMAAVVILEDKVETDSIEACEAVSEPYEAVVEGTQETSAELADGFEQAFIASVTNARGAAVGATELIPVETAEEQEIEELEFEEIVTLVVEADTPVEFVPIAGIVPLALLCPESESLGRILAADATGITAEIMDSPAENQLDAINSEAEYEDYAAEGMDFSVFAETILQGGMADGSLDQVTFANEKFAEIVEIAETVEVGANIMATEESIGSSRTKQDLRDAVPMAQQYEDLELSREQSGENLAMDNSTESEFECVFVEETGESSGFDICETVELAEIEAIAKISNDVGYLEPIECVDDQTIEAATAEEPPETVIVDDVIELRPVGTAVSVQNTGKVEERIIPMPHSYSCRLRCQKPGGIFQGPVLSFYCRFICQHGNY